MPMTTLNPREIAASFQAAGLDNAANEARWLCEFAVEHRLSEEETAELVRRRSSGEPFQYVLGNTEFYGLELEVGPGVLIPRPETEELVEHAVNFLQHNKMPGNILDLCTGSGAIALALASELPDRRIFASDLMPAALAWAERNRRKLRLDNVSLIKSDLFANIPKCRQFALLTANPPYVSAEEYAGLPAVVRDYEPESALLAEENGCLFYRLIAEQAPEFLLDGAGLFLEIGDTQGQTVHQIFESSGYDNIAIIKDLAGHDRILSARYHATPAL